jgi:hypothetical protein
VKKEKLNILIFLHFVGEFSAEEFPLPLSLPLVQHRWTKGAAAQESGEQAGLQQQLAAAARKDQITGNTTAECHSQVSPSNSTEIAVIRQNSNSK